ncbi:MAG: hypothetical protein P1U57_02800 [Oleibacter sp.]|nr:hypothetical protein [Thalassolituus sp.]
MNAALSLSIISAGLFFLNGLITGVIKYRQIMASPKGEAHVYIDICHRTSLMYAFACVLIYQFVLISQLPDWLELTAVILLVVYFAAAVVSYFIHGVLQDTDNQLKQPHKMGNTHISSTLMSLFMWSLIVGEIGGFLILFYGVAIKVI